jgi:hypothetical protein
VGTFKLREKILKELSFRPLEISIRYHPRHSTNYKAEKLEISGLLFTFCNEATSGKYF